MKFFENRLSKLKKENENYIKLYINAENKIYMITKELVEWQSEAMKYKDLYLKQMSINVQLANMQSQNERGGEK